MDKQIQFLLYATPDGANNVNVVVKNETIWLTQRAMADLFGVGVSAVSKHLANIYEEGELDKQATISKMEIVQKEGLRDVVRNIDFYNLDTIISVGYRINSAKATKFRIWATSVLKEYIKKGFVLNDEQLKQGRTMFGQDYFRELLERVRSIRASERRIWQQITDIFAECSIDYDINSDVTYNFFATVQNKFHFAITGKTAAEIIFEKVDHKEQNMGLKTWKYAPDGRILKSDVKIAKNYLSEGNIKRLERAVAGYFDYIEDLIERGNIFTMREFADSVNEFLAFRRYQILPDNGKITHADAMKKAVDEYEIFNRYQKINSDFDKFIKGTTGLIDNVE